MRPLHVIMGELTASRARLITLRATVPSSTVAIIAEVATETRLVTELTTTAWTVGSIVIIVIVLILLAGMWGGGRAWFNYVHSSPSSTATMIPTPAPVAPSPPSKTAEEIADCQRRIANTPPYIDPDSLRGRRLCGK